MYIGGLTARCSGRTRVARRLQGKSKLRATRRAAERERYTHLSQEWAYTMCT